MILREQVPLHSLTTFRVGGKAQYVAECTEFEDVVEAVRFAKEHSLPIVPVGSGSNILAADAGFEGLIIHMRLGDLSVDEEAATITAGAGVVWDQVVAQAGLRCWWGMENLAGIPGTVGASPVQNIGAYGSELKDTVLSVEVFDVVTEEKLSLNRDECVFGYRDSRFKREPGLIITSVTFQLEKDGAPQLQYKDLREQVENGVSMQTPKEIAQAVRSVRSHKFPDMRVYGTAGSFFKNPTISTQQYEQLLSQYPGLPGFPQEKGVKIPLAWILDHVLHLNDFAMGRASLFKRQPLVLVTEPGATSVDVERIAEHVSDLVHRSTNILIEREVQLLPKKFV